MKIGLAQINTTVGDLPGNSEKILAAYRQRGRRRRGSRPHAGTGGDRLSAAGSPLQIPLRSRQPGSARPPAGRVGDVPLIVGFVDVQQAGRPGQFFHNAAAFLAARADQPQIVYKSLLPTYDVFDEARYFEPAAQTRRRRFANGRKLGITICEDIWCEPYLPRPFYARDPAKSLVEQGAEIILNLSASPFQCGKPRRRFEMIAATGRRVRPCRSCIATPSAATTNSSSTAIPARSTRGAGCSEALPRFTEEGRRDRSRRLPPGPLPPLPEEPAELFPRSCWGCAIISRSAASRAPCWA